MSETTFSLPTLDPPKRCPAPGKCHCLARALADPEPEEPESIWCMGLRKDDQFPGKERPIQSVPSDTIVSCNLIGSHSDQAGAYSTIMNIPDLHLILEVWMQALDKIGLLRQVFVAAVMSNKDKQLAEMFEKGLPVVGMDSVMTKVECNCEDLYIAYNYDPLPEGIERLMAYHDSLGHLPVVRHQKRVGNEWLPSGAEVEEYQRIKGEEE